MFAGSFRQRGHRADEATASQSTRSTASGPSGAASTTYFTLPVLVAMLSNHYGWLTQGPNNWLVLVLLMLAGALFRHSFVARHKALVAGKRVPWEYAVVGTAIVIGLAVWRAPAASPASAAAGPASAAPVSMAQVKTVVEQRCVLCHNAETQQKNVALHTPELIKSHARRPSKRVLKLMPPAMRRR